MLNFFYRNVCSHPYVSGTFSFPYRDQSKNSKYKFSKIQRCIFLKIRKKFHRLNKWKFKIESFQNLQNQNVEYFRLPINSWIVWNPILIAHSFYHLWWKFNESHTIWISKKKGDTRNFTFGYKVKISRCKWVKVQKFLTIFEKWHTFFHYVSVPCWLQQNL